MKTATNPFVGIVLSGVLISVLLILTTNQK
jgi:hypothetical protein